MARTTLKDYISPKQPFGPISAADIRDPHIFDALFHKENLLYYQMSSHPSLIVGRRGAGKTAFLRSVVLDPYYKYLIEFPPHQIFRRIVESIEEMTKGLVLVEEVEGLWNLLLWVTLLANLAETAETNKDLQKIKNFVAGLGVKQKQTPYAIMERVVKLVQEKCGPRPLSKITDFLEQETFNGVVFLDAQHAALDFLQDKNTRAIILLDTLEEFELGDAQLRHAISGLLKCQGSFHSPGSPCELRCCLPSELYHEFMAISSNPNKDFQHMVLLHWHAGELIRLAADRYSHYLQLYESTTYKQQFSHFNLDKRSEAVAFWHNLLPGRITNRIGLVETPLGYIVRHTQLLPRHLLMYLNRIALKNGQLSGSATKFTEDAIKEGIYEIEETICKEIFTAYQYVHPGAADACKQCIPHLPLKFSYGDLQRVYHRHGKGIRGVYDFSDLLKLFLEIGAIGRVTSVTGLYIEGIFEYTVPHRLVVSNEDELCLHPVFTEIFHALIPKPAEEAYAVYPYGSDIDGADYRVK